MAEPIDTAAFRELLLELRRRVSGNARQIQRDAHVGSDDGGENAHAGVSIHMADSASDTYDQDQLLDRLTASSVTLQEIDDALDRIDAGTFGQCEDCGIAIPPRRLKFKPHAALCIDCQRKEENG